MIDRKPLTKREKALLFLSQDGKCYRCKIERLKEGFYHDDHKLALVDGGTNDFENRALICLSCHKAKSAAEHKANSKAKRIKYGKARKGRPMAGSRKSRFKKHMDGSVSYR